MAQHGVVEAEAGFKLCQDFLAALDVEADVVSLGKLLDLVSQLTAAPVFDTVQRTTTGGNEAL